MTKLSPIEQSALTATRDRKLMAAWNNVSPEIDAELRPANEWTLAAWERVYQAAIKHHEETKHERPLVNAT